MAVNPTTQPYRGLISISHQRLGAGNTTVVLFSSRRSSGFNRVFLRLIIQQVISTRQCYCYYYYYYSCRRRRYVQPTYSRESLLVVAPEKFEYSNNNLLTYSGGRLPIIVFDIYLQQYYIYFTYVYTIEETYKSNKILILSSTNYEKQFALNKAKLQVKGGIYILEIKRIDYIQLYINSGVEYNKLDKLVKELIIQGTNNIDLIRIIDKLTIKD